MNDWLSIFSPRSLGGPTWLCWSWSLSLTSSSITCLRGWSGELANTYSHAPSTSQSCAWTYSFEFGLKRQCDFPIGSSFRFPVWSATTSWPTCLGSSLAALLSSRSVLSTADFSRHMSAELVWILLILCRGRSVRPSDKHLPKSEETSQMVPRRSALIPFLCSLQLSPKKTWEGFIGGFFSTIVFGILVKYDHICAFYLKNISML